MEWKAFLITLAVWAVWNEQLSSPAGALALVAFYLATHLNFASRHVYSFYATRLRNLEEALGMEGEPQVPAMPVGPLEKAFSSLWGKVISPVLRAIGWAVGFAITLPFRLFFALGEKKVSDEVVYKWLSIAIAVFSLGLPASLAAMLMGLRWPGFEALFGIGFLCLLALPIFLFSWRRAKKSRLRAETETVTTRQP